MHEDPPTPTRFARWLRRRWLLAALVAVALVGIGVAVAAIGTDADRPSDVAPPADGTPTGTVPATQTSEATNVPGPATSTPDPVATTTPKPATPAPTTGGHPTPAPVTRNRVFDVTKALADVRSIEGFGVRSAGSAAESKAAEYIADRLEALGYTAGIWDVPLPNGMTSQNIVARRRGSSSRVIVLGAHIDSKAPSPGANDNGTGCAALLEIARLLADKPVAATVEFVFFGAEEMIDSNPDHHHYGSRARVAGMSSSERANVAGMISVDMIGYGPDFVARTMLRGPQSMSDIVLARARATGVKMSFLKDEGATGWSDHEAYELAGIPAVWIEWRDDPAYHTAGDASSHLQSDRIRTAGQLVTDVLANLGKDDLEKLITR